MDVLRGRGEDVLEGGHGGKRQKKMMTMNVNGRDPGNRGKWICPAPICMSSINMLNWMMASSALSRNGRLDGAGMARGPEPVGFGSERQPRRTIEARRVSGGRLSTHRGTRHGMSSLLIAILTISSVFWIRFGMTRVSSERKLKYA